MKDKVTIVVLSGDLERALASFMIATSAASMGMEVTMFFTFWGLNILKRNEFDPEQTAYVGDMTHDIDAGKKAGVITVALGWGYQSKEKLMDSCPDHYLSKISELKQILN